MLSVRFFVVDLNMCVKHEYMGDILVVWACEGITLWEKPKVCNFNYFKNRNLEEKGFLQIS